MRIKPCVFRQTIALLCGCCSIAVCATDGEHGASGSDPTIGRAEVRTVPFDRQYKLRTATYTPSGKVLVSYTKDAGADERQVNLAVMNDDGSNFQPFFSQAIPDREKDNGIRFMLFQDNRRIFLGDFVLECTPSIDTCDKSALLPVDYPAEVAGGDTVAHRWSEIIVAPDNQHIAWTTLLANYSAVVLVGTLDREGDHYRIANPRVISTLEAFREDPEHPDGVLPNTIRNGEVKEFIAGGVAISMVGGKNGDLGDSVVQYLSSGDIVEITRTPGYDETTIFSPDEQLGITMTARFSPRTDLAILGLMPRPYPAALIMGLNMYAYAHSVTGVRRSRSGNVGPALIDIKASQASREYQGINLNTDEDWVYHSPMSWHPHGKRAMWLEGRRGEGRRDGGSLRIQVVTLLDYRPAAPVAAQATPDTIPDAATDLSVIQDFFQQSKAMDVKVYGHQSGHIEYHRTSGGSIEKVYKGYSDDGERVYNGRESLQANPMGQSVYTADIKLTGPQPGVMDLTLTFGPLQGDKAAQLIFTADASGKPATRGYVEYDGRRRSADELIP